MLEIELGHTHGSCVDFDGKSILAIGPPGQGNHHWLWPLSGLAAHWFQMIRWFCLKAKMVYMYRPMPQLQEKLKRAVSEYCGVRTWIHPV